MSSQLTFDLEQARDARDQGLRRVCLNNQEFLKEARLTAQRLCRSLGTITNDDVRRECAVLPNHPNAWGAVFKSRAFEWTGAYIPSAMVQRHGAMQRVWRLKPSCAVTAQRPSDRD